YSDTVLRFESLKSQKYIKDFILLEDATAAVMTNGIFSALGSIPHYYLQEFVFMKPVKMGVARSSVKKLQPLVLTLSWTHKSNRASLTFSQFCELSTENVIKSGRALPGIKSVKALFFICLGPGVADLPKSLKKKRTLSSDLPFPKQARMDKDKAESHVSEDGGDDEILSLLNNAKGKGEGKDEGHDELFNISDDESLPPPPESSPPPQPRSTLLFNHTNKLLQNIHNLSHPIAGTCTWHPESSSMTTQYEFLVNLSNQLLDLTKVAFNSPSDISLQQIVNELQNTLYLEVIGIVFNPIQMGPYGIQPTISLLELSIPFYCTAYFTKSSLTSVIHEGFEVIEKVAKVIVDTVKNLRGSLVLREYNPSLFAEFYREIQNDELV
ncbi:hypothetical protein BS47DRAFT_1370147, partial [Hydnum rufescens UP504]